jgi:hypothetical protein
MSATERPSSWATWSVLVDDASHRAVPVWLLHGDRAGGESLPRLVEEPGGVTVTAGVPEELGTRLLRAAGAAVTGVDIEMTKADAGELTPETAAARIEVGGRAGSRQVTARLGLGLAVAAATGAPVRLDSVVLDRLAVPVPGDDAIGPILDRLPPGRRDRRVSRCGPGQPAQGPAPAARVHHRAPARPHPRCITEDPHDQRPLSVNDRAQAGSRPIAALA